jgi:hypothetical protein
MINTITKLSIDRDQIRELCTIKTKKILRRFALLLEDGIEIIEVMSI